MENEMFSYIYKNVDMANRNFECIAKDILKLQKGHKKINGKLELVRLAVLAVGFGMLLLNKRVDTLEAKVTAIDMGKEMPESLT